MMEKISRRKALASVGGLTIGVPSVVSAENGLSEELNSLYETTKSKYGEKEARIGTRIVEQEIRRKQRRNLTEEKAYNRISKQIIENRKTEQWGKAIQRVDSRRRELLANSLDSNNTVGTNDDQECGCTGGNENYITIDGSEKELDDSGAAKAEASTSVTYDRQRTFTETGLYGSGYSLTRLFGNVYIDQDGNYDINSKYYRNFKVAGAQCTVSLFVRPSYGGVNAKRVETAQANRDGTAEYTKTFTLNGGNSYDIGVELISEGSSSSGEGDIADAYNSYQGRKLTIEKLSIIQY